MNNSYIDSPTLDEIMEFLADSKSGSPENAETLIFPAGAVNEYSPFSSACVEPIGIQYVLGSLSIISPFSFGISSPLNASRSIKILALGIG